MKPDNYWDNLQKSPYQDVHAQKKRSSYNQNQLQKAGDQILSNSSYFQQNQSVQDSKDSMRRSVEMNNKGQQVGKMGKVEFEKQKKEFENRLQEINRQFVKKEDIIDILEDVKKEVNFEMRLQMRKMAEDIKLEKEKKQIEEELRKKHFEDYFKFLMSYYEQNDIKQYYQLFEEYNTRLRQMAVSNLPSTMFQTPSAQFNQPISQFNQHTFSTPQQTNNKQSSSGDQLYDGYYNRGSMIYASPLHKNQNRESQQQYMNSDNTFNKVGKDSQFSNVGQNGFAISEKKADKEKRRIDVYLNDNMKFGQSRVDNLKQIQKQKETIQRYEQDQINQTNLANNKGLKLFGGDYYKQQKIQNQIDQERKYQELLMNPNGNRKSLENQRYGTQTKQLNTYNSQTNLSELQTYQKMLDTYTNKNQTTVSDTHSFKPSSQSYIKLLNTDNY